MASGERVRYGLLLLTLIATYLVSALTHSTWGGVVHVAFVGAITLLALGRTRLGRRASLAAQGATVATAIGAGVCAGLGRNGGSLAAAADAWSGLALLLTVAIIVEGVVRLERVNAQSLYGALSAYLLIGLTFAAFFGTIGNVVSGPFFANGQPFNAQTLQYFSFTTLTTLGYGDFTAVGSFGRAVAVLEAMAGQVFLATLVARLVSAYGMSRPRDGD
jgi:hypothetical protein